MTSNGMHRQETDFASFIAAWPPPVELIALMLRKVMFDALPRPIEMIDTSSKVVGYGFGKRHADIVCSLIPSNKGVKLGLACGVALPDPKSLLAGESFCRLMMCAVRV